MANEHPFQALFETFGRLPSVHAESVNRQAYENLWQVLAVGTDHAGRCILLKAPRAGHGKTHLLSRIQHNLGTDHEFIPLHAASGSFIDAGSVTADVLIRLSRPLPAGGGLCVLDLLVRKLFSLALQPLVRSGEVPCQDREGALAALRNRPVETFDFHHPNAVTAHWARENFEVLGPRLALELAQRTGAPLREVMFWVDAMFRFAATPVEHPSRAGSLIQAVTGLPIQPAQVFERLGALLGLLTQLVRIVLVADDLEGFSSDESAALRFASFLGSLRHSAERVDTILSINRDIWESAFLPRLSGGLADRLSEVVIELEPLNREEMVALLDSRAIGLGERIFARIDLTNGERHARGIIRAASEAWLKAARSVHPLEAAASQVPSPAIDAVLPPVLPSVQAEAPMEQPVVQLEPPAPPVFQTEPPAQPQPTFQPEAPAQPVIQQETPTSPVFAAHVEPVVPAASWPAASEPQIADSPFQAFTSANAPVEGVTAPSASHEFLPPVEPVSVSAPSEIPSLFEPAPAVVPVHEEIVPVGRIITEQEMAEAGFQVPSAAPQVFGAATPPSLEPPVIVPDRPAAFAVAPAVVQPAPVIEPPSEPQAVVWNPPPVEQAPTWPGFGGPSPFQNAPAAEETRVVESVFTPASQAPAFGEQPAFVEPAVQPVAEASAAPAETKETDRVDELLRQFRERYARG